jgi:hypothetical protein
VIVGAPPEKRSPTRKPVRLQEEMESVNDQELKRNIINSPARKVDKGWHCCLVKAKIDGSERSFHMEHLTTSKTLGEWK